MSIIFEVFIVFLSVGLSAVVSFVIFKLEWSRKIESESKDQERRRYVILSSYKSKMLELPILLENIFDLDDIHGQGTIEITYQDYKDRIIEKHIELIDRIDTIFSDSNLLFIDIEDINVLVKLKENVIQSHIDIINDDFYGEDIKKELYNRGNHVRNIINELPGLEKNTAYLEELKFEFGWK